MTCGCGIIAIALLSGSYALGVADAGLVLLAGLHLAWERGVFGKTADEVDRKDDDEEVSLRERAGALLSFGPTAAGRSLAPGCSLEI